MKKIVSILVLFSLTFNLHSQRTYNCLDSTSAVWATASTFYVDTFHTKTPVELHLSTIEYEGKTINVDFHYKGEIEYETLVLPVTDSIAVKLILAKVERFGSKCYMYNLLFCYKEGNCWIQQGTTDYLFIAYSRKMELANSAVGAPGAAHYTRVINGWLKIT